MDEIRGKGGVQNAHLNHVDPEIDLKKETFDDDDDITKALLRGLEVKLCSILVMMPFKTS